MAETTEQYRARINQLKTSIENEPLIKKMRDDIAEGISKTGNRQADIEVRQDTLEDDFVAVQQDASSASPTGAEVAVARAGFTTLDERLTKKEQEVTAQLEQTELKKADVTYVDQTVSRMSGGAIKGTYTTLAALKTAYPQGAIGPFQVEADNNRYIWDIAKLQWVSIGPYEPAEIAKGDITSEKIADEAVTFLKLDQRIKEQLGEYGPQLLVDSTKRKRYDVNTLELVADPSYAFFFPVPCTLNDVFRVSGIVDGVVMYLDNQQMPIGVAYVFGGNQSVGESLIVTDPDVKFIGVTNYWGTKDSVVLKKYEAFDISAIAEQKSVVDDMLKLDVNSVAVNPVILWSNSNGTCVREVVEDGISLTIANTSADSDYIVQFGDFLSLSEQRPAFFALEYSVVSVSGNVTMYDSNNSSEPLYCTLGAHDYLYESTVALTKYQLQITIPVGATIALTINHMNLFYQKNDINNGQLTSDLVHRVINKSRLAAGTYFITKPRTSLYSDTAKYADVAGKIENKWEGKTYVSYGDSNTENGGWQDHLVNNLGLVHINKGRGGTNATGTDTLAGWQDERINSFPEIVDLVTIMFGTNDWSNVYPIGTDNGDTTTFMGAYGVIIKKIQTKYPNARLVLVSPPFRTNSLWTAEPPVIPFDTGDDKDMKKYIEAVEYIAFKYGCKFVNAWADMGVNEFNFKHFLQEESWPVHLGKAGKNRLGEVLIGKIKEIEPIQ